MRGRVGCGPTGFVGGGSPAQLRWEGRWQRGQRASAAKSEGTKQSDVKGKGNDYGVGGMGDRGERLRQQGRPATNRVDATTATAHNPPASLSTTGARRRRRRQGGA